MKDHDCQEHREPFSHADADGIVQGFRCAVCEVVYIEGIVVMNPEFYLSEPGPVWGQP